MFLAGAERAATPNARIGFHRPSFPGLDDLGEEMMLQDMRATYRAAGISEPFLDQIATTPAASMWYPPRQKLVDNGVINRTALGGEVASSTNDIFDSKASIERVFRALPHVVAMERHFPGTIEQAVNAAWSARRSGASDEDIMTATRQIIASNVPQILAMTTDERVDEFTQLMIDQLRAARSVGYDACARLLRGELNIASTLPPQLREREMSWVQRALDGPLTSRPPPDPAELDAAYGGIFELLSEEEFSALVAMEAEGADTDPAAVCDTSIVLYETALLLPQSERSLVLRDMLTPE